MMPVLSLTVIILAIFAFISFFLIDPGDDEVYDYEFIDLVIACGIVVCVAALVAAVMVEIAL